MDTEVDFGITDDIQDSDGKNSVSWFASLQTKLLLVFCALLLLIGFSVTFILDYNTRALALEQSLAFNKEKGFALANKIGKEIVFIEMLASGLAVILPSLPPAEAVHRFVIPGFLQDDNLDSIMAGGGLWPEPYAFDPEKERASLFWHRNSAGKLEFIDHYNQPSSESYHDKEWYVAAKFHEVENPYWSKTFIDPETLEPLVTCAVPYSNSAGEILGVVTIDMKLSGVAKLFKKEADEISGYIFAVDQDDSLIIYPDPSEILLIDESAAKVSARNKSANELQENEPGFTQFNNLLQRYRSTTIANSLENADAVQLSSQIANASSEISNDYAHLLTANLAADNDSGDVIYLADFINETDPVLGEPSLNVLFSVPDTNWKMSVVSPVNESLILGRNLLTDILPQLMSVAVLCLLLAFWTMQRILIAPMKWLVAQLESFEDQPENDFQQLHHKHHDELGQVVKTFNQRTAYLQKAKFQAEHALEMKKNFLTNMSHEIRTPMNGILLSAEILTDYELETKPKQYAETICQSSQALLSIINDILDYSKIESGKVSITREIFDVEKMATEVKHLFQATAERKEIAFEVSVDESAERLYQGDETRIRQVVLNLIGNAIKFTKEGNICLKITSDNVTGTAAKLYFTVSDTGIGIAADKQENIFNEFTQADASISREYGGTGLGLSISKQLCEVMGGSISVTSTPGKGSTFVATIPVEIVAPSSTPRADTAVKDSDKEITLSGKVLLAEDNEVNQMLAKSVLKKMGLTVAVAENGQKALDALDKDDYDIVLMDIQMPVMDGISASRNIRSSHKSVADIPIVAVSANVSEELMGECLEAGMNGFLRKPFSRAEMARELTKFLS